MNLVGQAAGYLGSRQPAPSKKGGGMHMPMLSPLQFGKTLGTGGLPTPTVPGMGGGSPWPGMGEAAGGAGAAEELLPLAALA